MKEEILKYYELNGIGLEQIRPLLDEFVLDQKFNFPVCILSHKFDKRRSKFLVQLERESSNLRNDYFIFTYEDQKELYSRFESLTNKIKVIYVPLDKKYSTLTGKRQFILEWNIANKNENAFFIEDDCYNFCLPVGSIIESNGNIKNKKFIMTLNLTFGFWQFLVEKKNLYYSGPVNNMDFAFRDLRTTLFFKTYCQVIQAVHINVLKCLALNLNFDEDSGWDDYDMILQQCIFNAPTVGFGFSYDTPALKSGNSAMSASLDALKKRCEINTNKLLDKWGPKLVRLDTKKGLYNAKINWSSMKSARLNNIPLKDLIISKSDTLETFF